MARKHPLARAEEASVAPLVALSLFALIGVGGLAFDYARLATMHSELQNAADQAALAAATQLDGGSNAMARAELAARSLLANETRFANDGSGLNTAVASNVASTSSNPNPDQPVKFYATHDDAEADLNGWFATSTAANANKNAKFVRVLIAARTANFAFTPIVAALSSGPIAARATAGLGSAICKVPPVMMCNPAEPNNNSDEQFDYNPAAGIGLKLITGDASAPGNFGWLESGLGNGASDLAAALGYNSPPGECQPITGVTTKTGMNASVMSAFNTRFDVFANGNQTCPSQLGGTCSPSVNTRKDLFCASNNGTSCQNGNWNWDVAKAYKLPVDTVTGQPVARALRADGSEDPPFMGYPRDMCHATLPANQTCGITGNGVWDRDAYFRVNYQWNAATWPVRTGMSASATRWQVYQWELAHPMVKADGSACVTAADAGCRGVAVAQSVSGNNKAFGNPANGVSGVSAGPSQADRRRLSVAVLNCRALGLNGHAADVPVATWLDVFLVEPVMNRGSGQSKYTDAKDVYVEVIGRSDLNGAGGVGQVVRRDVPYLIR